MRRRFGIPFLLCASVLTLLVTLPEYAASQDVGEQQLGGFPVRLSGEKIWNGSVTIANITGDSRPEIIVGGDDGRVYAIRPTGGAPIWEFRTDTVFRSATRINSAPAVADVTGDGVPEIIVSVGGVTSDRENGGVIVLSNAGRPLPGWPQFTKDFYDPRGITEGVWSSPTVADFTGDGIPEIAYGGFDQHIYLKRANGTNLPGWPKFVHDTVWSSPAAADLNGDGVNELIIGVDAHDYDDGTVRTLLGGYVKVFRGNGTELPGWPQHQDDAVYSSPAIADLDNDGRPEVIIGGGLFYDNRPGLGARGRTLTAYRANGSKLWQVKADEPLPDSPALGDVNGDGQLDVVIVSRGGNSRDDRFVYAFNGRDGRRLWKVRPKNIFDSASRDKPTGELVLGDYNGDGAMDAFVPTGGQIAVLNGRNGEHFTGTTNPWGNAPVYGASATVEGAPALGDLNGDGNLELVVGAASGRNGLVSAWTLRNESRGASWPMYRHDPAHLARVEIPRLNPSNPRLVVVLPPGGSQRYSISFDENWTAQFNDANQLLDPNRRSGSPSDTLVVTVTAPNRGGVYSASITVRSSTAPTITIPVTVYAAPRYSGIYLPLTIKR